MIPSNKMHSIMLQFKSDSVQNTLVHTRFSSDLNMRNIKITVKLDHRLNSVFYKESQTMAGASVWRHAVSVFRAGTVVTSWNVHTLVGTEMTNALRTFINICTAKM